MVRQSLSRRRFGSAAIALTTVGLAGCSDDTSEDTGNDDDDEFELENPGELTINLENENGEPVSSGVEVTIAHDEKDSSLNYSHEIQDGTIVASTLVHTGSYTITVESTDGEFDTVEKSVTVEEETDEEVTIVLDGAPADSGDNGDDGDN